MAPNLPSDDLVRSAITGLSDLIKACETHPQWTPPAPNPTLYFMWDFVQRSRHNLKETFFADLSSITAPQPASSSSAPSQPATPEKKHEVWNDVRGRTTYTQVLMEDRGPKLTIICGGNPDEDGIFDFGDLCREKVRAAVDSFGDGPIEF